MIERKDMTQPADLPGQLLPDHLLAEAADWWLRRLAAPEDQALARDLAQWRGAHLENEQAWQLAAASWRGAVDSRAKAARPRRRLALAAAAMAAGLLLAAFYPSFSLWLRADYRSDVALIRPLTLPDGSQVTLGADSAIALHFSPDRREVELLQGEAYFDVATDKVRPFVVVAAELNVTVTGTEFAVGRLAESFDVGVAEGSVHTALVSADGALQEIDLRAGDHLKIARADAALKLEKIEPTEVAAWRRGQLVALDVPLADVVETIGRYQPGLIVFADTDLAARRITGVFDLTDPPRAMRGILAPYHGVVRQVTPYLTLLDIP